MVTKTGIMLGLGETWDEILEAMRLLREADVDVLTIGQYLRPSRQHLPLMKYYTPAEFMACGGSASRWASRTSSPGRWCAPATTPPSRFPAAIPPRPLVDDADTPFRDISAPAPAHRRRARRPDPQRAAPPGQ